MRVSTLQTYTGAFAGIESRQSELVPLSSAEGALDRMILMRNQVSDEINVVQNAQSQGDTQTLAVTQRQSDLRDLDYAQAVSAMQSSQTGLEAALKSYATVARTSLFQLIN